MAINKRLRKDGTVGWQVVVDEYDPGTGKRTRHTVGTFSPKKLAQQKERDALAALDSNSFVRRSTVTVGDLLDLWLESITVKPKTYKGYRETVDVHLRPELGSVPAQSVTEESLQRMVNTWKASKGTRTIQLSMLRLSSAYKHAIRLRMVTVNPCAGVVVPRSQPSPPVIWSEHEVSLFLEESDKWYQGIVFRILIETGMRRGEVIALRWQDVDSLAKEIRVVASKTSDGRRVILISDGLARRLQHHRKKNMSATYVLESRKGTTVRSTTIARALDRICRQAGVPRVHIHGLRHLAATRMLRAIVPEQVAQARMGHSSSAMLRRIYQHADADMQREAVEALDALGRAVNALSNRAVRWRIATNKG